MKDLGHEAKIKVLDEHHLRNSEVFLGISEEDLEKLFEVKSFGKKKKWMEKIAEIKKEHEKKEKNKEEDEVLHVTDDLMQPLMRK